MSTDTERTPSIPQSARVVTNGGFFEAGDQNFAVKGVTYGTFAARSDGELFPEASAIAADFEAMAELGINVVRVYTLPPVDLVELAEAYGLRLFAGLHYHDWRMDNGTDSAAVRRIRAAGEAEVDRALERLAGNPVVLAVSVGNEIPVDLVRLHGAQQIEAVLSRLIERLHAGDPDLLATYVNFPTSEFLSVPGQDFASFNVYLDDPAALRAYVQRLQVMNEGIPVLISEIGVPQTTDGDVDQADALASRLRAVDESGCAGAVVFAWTDDWVVDGGRVTDWRFGITESDRTPKPAASALRDWAARRSPAALREYWPSISAVVCAYNEEEVIDACIRSLRASSYPNLEIIVCDDGSTDRTAELAASHGITLLSLVHGGLSIARNVGFQHASGEIVAYLDTDAVCHPDWPFYLALSFESGAASSGGPNLPFDKASSIVERAVAAAPGTPRQVLVSHDSAEHVPGCNMAFRRDVLRELGGFNPRFTTAGDDVDMCWRITDAGYAIAYAPAAQIRHHRRDSLRRFLRQQRGYGAAESLLAGVHSRRFNRLGQPGWVGTVYGMTPLLPRWLRPLVYTGWQGQAPYQTVQRKRAEEAAAVATALVPITVLAFMFGAFLSLVSPWWSMLAVAALVLLGGFFAAIAGSVRPPRREQQPLRYRLLVAALHLAQPLARTWGRLGTRRKRIPSEGVVWLGDRRVWLDDLIKEMSNRRVATVAGPSGRTWDLRGRWGPLAVAHVNVAVVWAYEARARVRVRPTWGALLGVVAVNRATWGLGTLMAVAATAGMVAATAASVAILRSKVRVAILTTASHCSMFRRREEQPAQPDVTGTGIRIEKALPRDEVQ